MAITTIPGNHDAHLRRDSGLERPGFRIQRQAVYLSPAGERLLVRHGDEYVRLIRFHAGLAESLARLQERPSAGINGLRAPFHRGARPHHLHNTGRWPRSQPRLGRTALVADHDGSVGMERYDRRRGIEPFQPPRFPFNTYPMRPCPGCALTPHQRLRLAPEEEKALAPPPLRAAEAPRARRLR